MLYTRASCRPDDRSCTVVRIHTQNRACSICVENSTCFLLNLTGAILTHKADIAITGSATFAHNSADRDGGEKQHDTIVVSL